VGLLCSAADDPLCTVFGQAGGLRDCQSQAAPKGTGQLLQRPVPGGAGGQSGPSDRQGQGGCTHHPGKLLEGCEKCQLLIRGSKHHPGNLLERCEKC